MEQTEGYSYRRGSGSYTTRTSWRVLTIVLLLTLLGFSVALVLSRPATPVSALTTVPTKMNFQGRLTDSAGNIKPNGTYNMRLKLYTVASAGSPVWSEDRLVSAAQGVPVTNGLFSIQLGTYTSLPASLFASGPLYLEVELASPATATSASPTWSEGPMSPRNQLATSAYAYNAETLDGLDSTAFAAASGSGSYIQNTTSPQTADFNVTGSGTATSFKAALFDTATATTLNIGMNNATGISLTKDTTVAAGKTITLIGGITSLRPVSPAEGMIYFDTSTKQMLTYANGKWQADRSTATKVVAASNSSQAAKDAADYVVNGEIGDGRATLDGDQLEINQALSSAAGGRVYLMPGTYFLDDTILIPNNTVLSGSGKGTVIELKTDDPIGINAVSNTDKVTGENITIQDVVLEGRSNLYNEGFHTGIMLSHTGSGNGYSIIPGTRIQNVEVKHFSGAGFTLTNSSNLVVSHSIAQGNGDTGFAFSNGNHIVFEGNSAIGNGYYGVYFGASTDSNHITDNIVEANGGGLYVSSNSSVTGNTVSSNYGNGIDISSKTKVTVTGNTLDSNEGYGISLSSTTLSTIASNTIVNSGLGSDNYGIVLSSSDNNTVTGNTISDSSATTTNYAIDIRDSASDSNHLSNNVLNGGGLRDLGSGTVYANQDTGSGNMVSRAAGAYEIQGSAPVTAYSEGLNSGTIPTGWTTSGDAVWAYDSSVKSEGSGSFKSGVLGNSQNSYLEYTYNATDYETLAFDWKVSSEYGWDFLYFCLDGTSCQKISGEQDWVTVKQLLPPGVHALKWYYAKDGATVAGSDAGWVDNLRVTSMTYNLQASDGSVLLAATSSNDLYTESQVSIKASADSRPLDPTELIDSNFSFTASAGWTGISGTGQTAIATHDGTIGNTTALTFSPALTVTPGYYQLTYDLSGATTGSMTTYVAGKFSSIAYSSTTSRRVVVEVTSSGSIEFRPSSTYNGTITNVSLKRYEDTSYDSAFVVKDTSNTSILEVRGRADSIYLGNDSGKNAITGSGNTSLGYATLANVKTGGLQTAIGSYALQNSDAYWNTAFGANSMQYTTTGDANTAVGADTLTENINGFENVALGYYALHENISGDYNVSLGTYSLSGNTTGDNNIAIGSYTLDGSDSGSDNVAVGGSAMSGNSSGSGNVALGIEALGTNDTGSYNIALGYGADVSSGALQNAIAIGYNSVVDCTNCMALGGLGANAVKVGIGTSAPSATLDVQGSTNINGGKSTTYSKALGGATTDSGRAVAITSDGGSIITGTTSNYGAGSGDMLLTRLDASGNVIWSKTWGSTGYEEGTAVATTNDGGFVVVGITSAPPLGAGSEDAFIVRYDSSGNVMWNKTWGGTGMDDAYAVVVAPDGGIIMGGTVGSFGAGSSDIFLVRYDAAGNLTWNKTRGGANIERGYNMTAYSDGGVIVTGQTYTYGAGGGDMLTVRFDASGNVLWDKTWGGTGIDYGYSVTTNSSGDIYVGGLTYSYGAGGGDVLIAKYDSTGTLLWNRLWGGSTTDTPRSIKTDINGNVIVVGDTGSYGAGNLDVFILKYDFSGTFLWNKTFGGASAEKGFGVDLTTNDIVVIGETSSYGSGGSDLLLTRFDNTGSVSGCVATMCKSPSASKSTPSVTLTTPSPITNTPAATTTTPSASVASPTISVTTILAGSSYVPGLSLSGGASVQGDMSLIGNFTVQGSTIFSNTVTVGASLNVSNSVSVGYVQTINNTSTTNTADGLLINLGVANASRSTGNQFISFAGNGIVAGKIWGGASAVAYVTTGADYAEYFRADPDHLPKAGELVALDKSRANGVTHASSGDMIAGVISTTPGFVGNGPLCRVDDEDCDANYEKYNVLVSLVGQVPLKVTGNVRIGDALGASDIPGVASTVTSGSIVGYALTTAKDGMVQVLIRPTILNPASGTGIQGGDGIFSSMVVNGLASVGSLVVTGDATVRGELYVEGHVIAKGAKPTITAGPAVGGSTSSAAVDGVDGAGTVTLVAATQQNTTGVLAHIRFAKPFTNTYKITLSPTNDNATDLRVYILKTSDGFDIVTKDEPQAGQTYEFDYIVMGAKN